MSSLLPPNSTQLEKAVEQATKSLGEIPVPIRTLWNAADCPEAFLPWLAWAYSVDQWNDDWTIQQKRATVDVAIRVHQKKGTPAAMKTAIAALGYQLELVEWWQPTARADERAPGTFGIDITLKDGQGLNATPALLDTINRTKNTRSHLWGIRYKTHSRGQQYLAAAQSHGLRLHIGPEKHDMRIETWMGELNTLPSDRLIADGSTLEIALYPDLFKCLGYRYSEWDENDTENAAFFRLPDLRGRAILGTTSSAEVGDYQADKLMWHSHGVTGRGPQKSLGLGGMAHLCSAYSTEQIGRTRNGAWRYKNADGSIPIEYKRNMRDETRFKNIGVYFVIKTNPTYYKNTIGEVAFNPCETLPKNALLCNGEEKSRLNYSHLFSIIGTIYGSGDGSTTFNLPTIDDIYIRGTAHGSANDPDATQRDERPDGVAGDNVGTKQSSKLLGHVHGIEGREYKGTNAQVGILNNNSLAGKPLIGSDPRYSRNCEVGGEADKEPFANQDGFADKNYMRSLKMQAVIFYA